MKRWTLQSVFAVLLIGTAGVAHSDEKSPLDWFDAIDGGVVEATFISKDASIANIRITNLTDLPIVIQLPSAIAAVPILAQFGNGQGQGQGAGQGAGAGAGGGGGQPVGGGVQNGNAQNGNGGGNANNGGGIFRIAPNKSMRFKASTVCLENGKPEPHPRMTYRMVPIEQVTKDKSVHELCARLGRKEISQSVAQAAAWHLTDKMSWKELSTINRFESKYIGEIRYFQADELQAAQELVEQIRKPVTLTSNRH